MLVVAKPDLGVPNINDRRLVDGLVLVLRIPVEGVPKLLGDQLPVRVGVGGPALDGRDGADGVNSRSLSTPTSYYKNI